MQLQRERLVRFVFPHYATVMLQYLFIFSDVWVVQLGLFEQIKTVCFSSDVILFLCVLDRLNWVWIQPLLLMQRVSRSGMRREIEPGTFRRWIWYVLFRWTMISDVVQGCHINVIFTLQMFFPLLCEDHWVLVCICVYMKQIAFFDSLTVKSEKSSWLLHARNLVSGFFCYILVFLSSCLPVSTYLLELLK